MPKINPNNSSLRRIAQGGLRLSPPPGGAEYYLANDLAQALGTPLRSLYRWISEGRLPATLRGGYLTVAAADAQAFVSEGATAKQKRMGGARP
jgi:hypothetical protein